MTHPVDAMSTLVAENCLLRAENERLKASDDSMIDAMRADNSRLYQEVSRLNTHITKHDAELDRLTGRVADLKIENWQLKGALGYEVPGQIPCGDFKCGLCEAKAQTINDQASALVHAEKLVYESGLRLGEMHRQLSEQIERLRHALRVMIGEAGESMSYSERCAMVRAELEHKP